MFDAKRIRSWSAEREREAVGPFEVLSAGLRGWGTLLLPRFARWQGEEAVFLPRGRFVPVPAVLVGLFVWPAALGGALALAFPQPTAGEAAISGSTWRPPPSEPEPVEAPSPLPVKVPDLTGLDEADARRRLADLGLSLEVGEPQESDVEPGHVAGQDFPVGGEVAAGSVVVVRLAAARAPEEPTAEDDVAVNDAEDGFRLRLPGRWTADLVVREGWRIHRYRTPEGDEVRVGFETVRRRPFGETVAALVSELKRSHGRRYREFGLDERYDETVWDFEIEPRGAGSPRRERTVYLDRDRLVAFVVECDSDRWTDMAPTFDRVAETLEVDRRSPEAAPERDTDLDGLTPWELSFLRNEPFARRGLIFARREIQEHFEAQPWYEGTQTDQAAVYLQLSADEKAEVKRILDYQKRNGKLPPKAP